MSEIIEMYGIHNGSWMTNTRDLIDAVNDYDYDLGRAVEEQLLIADVYADEYEDICNKNWELEQKADNFESAYDTLNEEHEELKKEYEKLKKEYEELEKEYERITSQLDETSGFHFYFTDEV